MDNTTKRSIFNGAPITKNTVQPAKTPFMTKPSPSSTSNHKPVSPLSPSSKPASSPLTSPTNIPRSRTSNSSKKPTTKSAKKSWLFILMGIIICIIVGITIAIIVRNNTKNTEENSEQDSGISNPTIEDNTEEINAITKETIDKYAEVTVEGYHEVEDGSMEGKAVIVKVQNKSEETVSLAIEIGAYDDNDTVLETSSLYAEGIGPSQTYSFNTFVYTELSEEQLRTAKFKVYRASTYNTEGIETEIQSTDETEPIEETQPAEANSIED